jgi:hypothetical protein
MTWLLLRAPMVLRTACLATDKMVLPAPADELLTSLLRTLQQR